MTPDGACSSLPTCTHRAGDADRATALLEQARAAAAPGSERADRPGTPGRRPGKPRAERWRSTSEALVGGRGDDALQATIHLDLRGRACWSGGFERGVEHGELAVRAASRAGDAALRCRALAAYGDAQFNSGQGIPTATMEEAIAARTLAGRVAARRRARRGSMAFSSAGPRTSTARARSSRSSCESRGRGTTPRERQMCCTAEPARVAVRELGGGRPVRNRPDRAEDAARPADAARASFPLPSSRLTAAGSPRRERGRTERSPGPRLEGIGIAQSGHGWVLGFVELSRETRMQRSRT